jgi:CRP-like cAMP-binding protein
VFLIRFGKTRRFAEGEALMTQGEPSLSVHFILEGQVRVERQRRSDAQPIQLAMLGSGEIVGEMGVMVDLPRSATVTAAMPTTTLELDTASFERAARAFPILHRVLAKLLSERLRRTSERVTDRRKE